MSHLNVDSGERVASHLLLRLECDGKIIVESAVAALALPFVIGRRRSSQWMTPADDMSVSGSHAEVFVRRRALWLRDLDSRNGVYVMGRRVREVKLTPGVQVGIGHCRLVVEEDRRSVNAKSTKRHRLVGINGQQAGRDFELKDGVNCVGCGIGDGISCASLLVSKRHAEIVCKPDDSCWIRDCGSRNGTLVNGIALKDSERLLRDGDIVAFADCEFKFCDRNKPTRYPWAKMLFVAFATASLCCGAYFLFLVVFPSAEMLLNAERQLEWKEDFNGALAMLERVSDARGGGAYVDEVARRRGNIAVWTNTRARWKAACEAFLKRYWVDASKDLGALLSNGMDNWGWNTTTAQEEKRKATAMKDLLDVFLDARKALGGSFSEAEHGKELAVLERCLHNMDVALRRTDWDATLPTGPLREDMEDQRTAMQAVVSDIKKIDKSIAGISRPASDGIGDIIAAASGFEKIIAELEGVARNAENRRRIEEERAKGKGRKFVSSDIVPKKCRTYLPSLEAFISTRKALSANCTALASLSYDKVTPSLPLPSVSQADVLASLGFIREGMRKANERLCEKVRSGLEDQIKRLKLLGISDSSTPECILALLDNDRMNKVFLCDTLNAKSRPPSAMRGERIGEYDKILGMEEFGAFMQAVEHDRAMPRIEEGGRPAPLLMQAILTYRQLFIFSECCGDQDWQYLLKMDIPSGNKLRDIAGVVAGLKEKRALLVDSLWGKHFNDMRANIIAHATALALDGVGKAKVLDDEDVNDFVKERKAWKVELERLDKQIRVDTFRVDVDVDKVRTKILKLAIPGVSTGRAPRHWEDAAAAAEKQRRSFGDALP